MAQELSDVQFAKVDNVLGQLTGEIIGQKVWKDLYLKNEFFKARNKFIEFLEANK